MENQESPRPRRPLPVPGATKSSPAQRPNTPIDESIPPSSFYSSNTQASHSLPSRPKNVGSSNTLAYTVVPDQHSNDYREPELVTTQDDDGDSVPPLAAPNDTGGSWTTDSWNQNFDISQWTNANASSGWDNNFSGAGYYTSKTTDDVPISGRQEYEEKNWWDPEVRASNKRPGPGILPPVLLEELHDSDHSLFSVSVTNPDVHLRPPSENPNSSSPTPPGTSSTPLYTAPPTEDEVRTSIPHPNAYYCPRENGWVILSWKSSSITPPLARSFENSDHPPLPSQSWRKQTITCIGDEGGKSNKTHHFHKYSKAVDALKLVPPLKVDDWDTETIKAKRRVAAPEGHTKDATPEREDTQSKAEEGKLLDLYMCCQCSFYCVASDLIPGVIPRKYLDAWIKDKKSNPPPGKTGEQAAVIALETIMLYVNLMFSLEKSLRICSALENILWKGEVRALKVNSASNTFQSKVGWNSITYVYNQQCSPYISSLYISPDNGYFRYLVSRKMPVAASSSFRRQMFSTHTIPVE